MAESIQVEEPSIEEKWLAWHNWRMLSVQKAIMLFCAKAHGWGYETFFTDIYFYARKDGKTLYVQYEELLHEFYSSGYKIMLNDAMEITLGKQDFDNIFSSSATRQKVGYFYFCITFDKIN